MITVILRPTQKSKIKWLNWIYRNRPRYSLYEFYKKPSRAKIAAYESCIEVAKELKSCDYGVVSANTHMFTFLIVYYKDGVKRIRYFGKTTSYDCEVVE